MCWAFTEDRLTVTSDDGTEYVGNWSESGGRLRAELPNEAGGSFKGEYADDVFDFGKRVLVLEAEDGTVRNLSWSSSAGYPDAGIYSREWFYYENLFVPEQGQADTIQGEVLRVTSRLSGMYGNSGGGNWLTAPDTYNAYAELTLKVLCDGTFDAETSDFVRKTVTHLQAHCNDPETVCTGPEFSDVDRIADLALEWCKRHQEPITRAHDSRMAF